MYQHTMNHELIRDNDGNIATPWGTADCVRVINEAVICVSTAAHGGYHVAEELNKEIPERLRQEDGWYEEDDEATIVELLFGRDYFETAEDYWEAIQRVTNNSALWPHPKPYFDHDLPLEDSK